MSGASAKVAKVIEIVSGPPGCGKSTRLRADAIKAPGLYVFFCPTIPLIAEQVEAFRKENPSIQLHVAHSAIGRGSVQRKLNDAREAVIASGIEHAVIFTTHDALMMRDLSGFVDWHARIDEAPNAATSGIIDMRRSWQWFETTFNLEQLPGTDWSEVVLKGAAPDGMSVSQDSLLKGQVEFIKLAASPSGVYVDLADWKDAGKVRWWSIWTPGSLKHFNTIQIAGASYETSLGAIVARKHFAGEVELRTVSIPMVRSQIKPTININYFTRTHPPSTTFWDSSEGRRMIKQVCDYLGAIPDLGYWSGNKEILKLMEWRLAGDRIQPKVAGLNQWREATKCAFIYSSGPTTDDEPLMETFDITGDEVRIAREDEDVVQFAMRGAIRNPGYEGTYDIYLYTEEQADRLAKKLTDSGMGCVVLKPVVEAGIMEVVYLKGNAGSKTTAAPKKAAVQKVTHPKTGKLVAPKSLKRAAQRDAKKVGKPEPKRGRPNKSSPKT